MSESVANCRATASIPKVPEPGTTTTASAAVNLLQRLRNVVHDDAGRTRTCGSAHGRCRRPSIRADRRDRRLEAGRARGISARGRVDRAPEHGDPPAGRRKRPPGLIRIARRGALPDEYDRARRGVAVVALRARFADLPVARISPVGNSLFDRSTPGNRTPPKGGRRAPAT